MRRSLIRAAVATGLMALAMTTCDVLWARYITRDDQRFGAAIAQGLAVFALFGGLLAWAAPTGARRWRLAALLPAGALIAAGFYPVARATSYVTGLLVCWVAMWLAVALSARWAAPEDARESLTTACLRAGAAAVVSGLSFWSVAWMWTRAGEDTGVILRALLWTWAFAPGFVALLVRREKAPNP